MRLSSLDNLRNPAVLPNLHVSEDSDSRRAYDLTFSMQNPNF